MVLTSVFEENYPKSCFQNMVKFTGKQENIHYFFFFQKYQLFYLLIPEEYGFAYSLGACDGFTQP